jgi:hypothetical protein
MEDGRKGLPYAPYLMFMIESVIGYRFEKDGLHEQYKIEKTHATGASAPTRRSSAAAEDILESSHVASHRGKKRSKIGKWIKALFSLWTYAADTAYQTRLESHEYRAKADLPPLPPPQSPPRFDNLPSLSDIDLKEEEEELGQTLSQIRRLGHYTSTTHRKGRVVVSDDNDDDDDGGAEDVDWENIQEESD